MKKKLAVLLLAAVCVVMAACNSTGTEGDMSSSGESSNPEQTPPGNEPQNTDVSLNKNPVSIRFEMEDEILTNEAGEAILYATYSQPKVTIEGNPAAAEKINAYFEAEAESFEERIEDCSQEADEFYQMSDGDAYYYEYVDMNVGRMDENLISFIKSEENYMGGVHGSHVEMGITFDSRTGELIAWTDLSANPDAFYQMVKEAIIQQAKNHPYSEEYYHPTDSAEFAKTIDDVLDSDSWYLTKEGLVIVANPYFIAPYAAGTFYFTIPYGELDGLKVDYAYEGAYLKSVNYGEAFMIDLDGDGKLDAIESYKEANENGMHDIALTVNGTDMGVNMSKVAAAEGEIYIETPQDCYYVVDLDENDDTLEIAIGDYGPSDDPVTYFFRYEENTLTYMGYVCDLFTDIDMEAFGNGTLSAQMPLDLIETVQTKAYYQVADGKLALIEQEWYEPDYRYIPEEYQEHDVLMDVTVYKEKSTDSEKVVLKAGEEDVRFLTADNVEWVKIQTKDGQIYYMHMVEMIVIDSDGEEVYATDVFENLRLAG